jgi:hypothetical protein
MMLLLLGSMLLAQEKAKSIYMGMTGIRKSLACRLNVPSINSECSLGFDCVSNHAGGTMIADKSKADPYTWPSGDLPTNWQSVHLIESPSTPNSIDEVMLDSSLYGFNYLIV